MDITNQLKNKNKNKLIQNSIKVEFYSNEEYSYLINILWSSIQILIVLKMKILL